MSDPTPTTVLDDRAAAAAGDLRERAAARAVPDFEPDAVRVVELPTKPAAARAWRLPVAAAAAVATLVAGSATWLVVDRLTSEQEVSSAAGPIRPFAATALPDDLAFAGAGDLDGGSTDGPFGPLAVYADGSGDPVLGAFVMRDFDPGDLDTIAADAVEVELADGSVAYEVDGGEFGVHQLLAVRDGGAVLLVSPTVDADELAGIAAAAEVVDDRVVLADGALPDGWRHLGDEDDAAAVLWPLAAMQSPDSVGSTGSTAVYLGDGEDRILLVTTAPASDLALTAVEAVAASTERLEVGGRAAVLAAYPGDDSAGVPSVRTLTWLTDEATVVRVVGLGLSDDELLEVADGVEAVAAEEWSELVRRTQLGEFEPDLGPGGDGGAVEEVEVARGTFTDGTEWVLRVADGGGSAMPDLSVALPSIDGTSSSSSGTMSEEGGQQLPPLYAHVETGRGARRFAGGLVTDEVAHLVFLDASGAVVGETDPLAGGGYRGWVTEYLGTLVVVAQDAAGGELHRLEITPDGSVGSTIEATTDDGG